ncbi:DUF1572 family protein [Candidatus Acetothermia bacterium]|nr:DUF1572 family protein [Candidatus Acetothermia bacterium]MBI3643485.1 DUF1572 family protein [Candidatus Acetothermia bacterium]
MKEIQTLSTAVEGAVSDVVKGYEFVTAKKQSWKPEESAKSAQEIANHVSYWNLVFERAISGGSLPTASESEWIESNRDAKTKEGSKMLLEKTSQAFTKAVKGLSSEQLSKSISLPWGSSSTLQAVLGNYNHISYHSGQLNYLQTLLGDTESH